MIAGKTNLNSNLFSIVALMYAVAVLESKRQGIVSSKRTREVESRPCLNEFSVLSALFHVHAILRLNRLFLLSAPQECWV